MEVVEKAILIKIPILKAKLKNFSAEDVDEECIEVIAESELEDIENVVLEIAADIIGLLREYGGEHRIPTREYNARMPTRRKEWWEIQKKGIIDEVKAHKRLVKAAVKRAKENLMENCEGV